MTYDTYEGPNNSRTCLQAPIDPIFSIQKISGSRSHARTVTAGRPSLSASHARHHAQDAFGQFLASPILVAAVDALLS